MVQRLWENSEAREETIKKCCLPTGSILFYLLLLTGNCGLDHLHSEPSGSWQCSFKEKRFNPRENPPSPRLQKAVPTFFENHTLTLIAASNALFKDISRKIGSSFQMESNANQNGWREKKAALLSVLWTFSYNGYFNEGSWDRIGFPSSYPVLLLFNTVLGKWMHGLLSHWIPL